MLKQKSVNKKPTDKQNIFEEIEKQLEKISSPTVVPNKNGDVFPDKLSVARRNFRGANGITPIDALKSKDFEQVRKVIEDRVTKVIAKFHKKAPKFVHTEDFLKHLDKIIEDLIKSVSFNIQFSVTYWKVDYIRLVLSYSGAGLGDEYGEYKRTWYLCK